MATVTPTKTALPDTMDNRGVTETIWSALAGDPVDVGAGVQLANHTDRSVQFGGTFGAGGTVIIEGSNDNVTWFTLNDAFDAPISFTSAGLVQILEITRYIRPRVTAGDGTTAIDVTLLASQRS